MSSELHQDIEAAFAALAEVGRKKVAAEGDISAAIQVIRKGGDDEDDLIKDIPGYSGMRDYYSQKCIRMVLHAYRFTAGARKYEDGEAAVESTRNLAMSRIMPVMVSALSDGVQIGQKASPTVRKYAFFDKLDKVFDNDSFRTDSAALSLIIGSDGDAYAEIKQYVEQCAEFMSHASGFTQSKDQEMLTKVWDLWGMVANSMFVAMYMAGRIVGERWAERDVLQGIELATEKNDG